MTRRSQVPGAIAALTESRSTVANRLSIPQSPGQEHSKALAEVLLACERLRTENAKLHALLAAHGISPSAAVAAHGETEQAAIESDTMPDSITSNVLRGCEKTS